MGQGSPEKIAWENSPGCKAVLVERPKNCDLRDVNNLVQGRLESAI